MLVTGTHINYYFLCKRKLWLFANGIQMEHTSDLVYEGKFIHETSYPRRSEKYQELELEGIKIDFYDARNKIVHEIKKSDKKEDAHEWQVKYYIYVLEKNGIEGVKGILEYPVLRQTTPVELSDDDRKYLKTVAAEITRLVAAETCPPVLNKSLCKNCSYYDFCYVGEDDQAL